MKKKVIGLLVCMQFLFVSFSVIGIEKNESNYMYNETINLDYPNDFELFVYCGGLDTWSPIYSLYINTSGEAFYDLFNKTTENFTLVSHFIFTNEEMNQIWDEIVVNDLFNLDNRFSRDTFYDGTFANITIFANSIIYSVQTENIDVYRFDNIVKTINFLTPNDNDLYYGALYNNPPLKPEKPVGTLNGTVNDEYEYTSVGFDIDDDDIYFMYDWGDGSTSEWTGPYKSGENITLKHSWSDSGDYSIRIKAKDDPNNDGNHTDGNESIWSESLHIAMPKNKISTRNFFNTILEQILKQYPFLASLFNFILTPQHSFESSSINKHGQNPYDSKSGTRGKIDKDKCEITIEIHITFYGEWVDKYWDKSGDVLTKKVKKDIESKWNREQWDKDGDKKADGLDPWRVQCKEDCKPRDPGCTVKFEAHIGHKKNVSSQDVPEGGNAKKPGNEGSHWIRPGWKPGDTSIVNAWGATKKLPTANNGMETTGVFHINDWAGVYAHEAGHLMGLKDHQDVKEKTDPSGKKVKYKVPNKKNPDGSWNLMAWPSGWPSQDDINKIVKDSGIECPCNCCPNDTKKPDNDITYPHEMGHVFGTIIVKGEASDLDSGVAELDYRLDWDGGYMDGDGYYIDPPENYVEYELGPINIELFIDPGDWITITTYATDAAGNTGEDSVTVILEGEEEDTTPPVTEKTIGQPQWEGGYTIASFTPIWLEAIDPEPGSGVNHIHYEVWQGGIMMGSEDIPGDYVEMMFGMYGVVYGIAELRWYAVDNANNVESMHYQEHFILY
jgi:hypothetical protein